MSVQVLVGIDDRSQVGEARRAAADITRLLNFDATRAGNVALAVTEAATNIVKHAGHGKLLLRPLQRGSVGGLEVLALDQGPGIANLGASLRDGHSTAGSMGTGLGALNRASDSMEIFSHGGKGTALRLEFWAQDLPPSPEPFVVGAVCVAKSGEVVSGDAWAMDSIGDRYTLMVADGLGHGPDAARAARAATQALVTYLKEEPAELLRLAHQTLQPTRGAAVSVARFEVGVERAVFAGVGNVAGRLESANARRQLVTHNGTLGHALRKVQEFPLDFPDGGLLILHSDGMSGHWTLADYPGLMAKHPGLIAGVLYRDHERGRDDVTVVVIKRAPSH